jgi:deazaflavin-dependent oxidoreductase (nitroreductase family)
VAYNSVMNDSRSNRRPFWIKPLAALASARPVVAILKRSIPSIDRWLMRRTKGRMAMTAGLPTLLLTTMGRKSGQPRSAPLLYLRYGDGWAVIGTNFGSTSHPAWYLNLKVNPQAELLVEGEQVTVSARDALQDERADLWSRAVQLYPGYETYKSRVGARQVPIVVFSRAKPSAARA